MSPVEDFGVLHGLAVKGYAPAQALAGRLAVGVFEIYERLDRLREQGLVSVHGHRELWTLTPEGKARHKQGLPPSTDALTATYATFLELNDAIKRLCTQWQMRDDSPNTHSDPIYDAHVIESLASAHSRVEPMLDDMGKTAATLSGYHGRLSGALGQLQSGDLGAFTGVQRDSYHDVWMELHRELLLLLRKDRSGEDGM